MNLVEFSEMIVKKLVKEPDLEKEGNNKVKVNIDSF